MDRRLLPALVLLILASSAFVGCGGGSSTPSTLTTLSAIDGDVSVMEAGTDNWTEGDVGMSLEDGDVVKTGDDSSAEITFFDGSTIELQPGTEVEIASLDIADSGYTTISLEQTIGATISGVVNIIDPQSSFEVETATGAAAVRGSIMVVCVTEEGTSWVANQQGNISSRAQGVELQIPEKRKSILKPLLPPELMPPNRPPLAQDDAFSTSEETPVTIAAPGLLLTISTPTPMIFCS